jgi:hypothetical protein
MMNLLMSLVLSASLGLPGTTGAQLLRVASERGLPLSMEVVYWVIGYPDASSTFGPPGDYRKIVDY